MSFHQCNADCPRCRTLVAEVKRLRSELARSTSRFGRLADRIRADATVRKDDPNAIDLGWALHLLSTDEPDIPGKISGN